ncbi:MAG TPA: mercuric reductase, partial [Desulfosarcina sp.]|nr:mercuric reductase [Desulfosarcina sp.]
AGRTPDLGRLDLDRAGVETTKTGVKVDAGLRSVSNRRVYAVGDAAGGPQFTHVAGWHAGLVIRSALFRLPVKATGAIPWVTYTDPELASIGMNERGARDAGLDYTVWIEAFGENDRALAEGRTDGRIKLILDKKERPLGVQILGPRAGDLIAEWVAALNGGVKLSTLASAIHPYPTLGEIGKRVTGSVFSPKIFSTTVQKGLKLFFNLKGRACTPQVGADGKPAAASR